MSKIKDLLLLALITILPTILLWLPFYLKMEEILGIPVAQNGMATIVANYDGPLYIVVAKTLYDPQLLGQFSFTLPAEYYPAHFPLFPALIRLFSTIASYPYAMLIVTILSSIMAIYYFKNLIAEFVDEKDVWWMTFVFSIFPARWLIVRSVGSAEPLFIAAIIASIFYFRKRKYLLAALFGVIAQLTKSPGILLFIAYGLAIFFPAFKRGAVKSFRQIISLGSVVPKLPLLLIPGSLLLLFFYFHIQIGDFFAYFNTGDNIHLFFPPFQVFDYSQYWVGTFWLEEIIFIYLFGVLGLLRLYKMDEPAIFWVYAIFFASIIFVSHRDIMRYSLPMIPFLLVAFSDVMVKREFRIALIFLLIPIYLFSIAYISNNVMPISDWSPLL